MYSTIMLTVNVDMARLETNPQLTRCSATGVLDIAHDEHAVETRPGVLLVFETTNDRETWMKGRP